MYHDTTFQWQQYAQSLEMDLQRTKKDLKYEELKWIYWQVKRKYEKCKTEFNYGMEVGKSVCAEYLYYEQSYAKLLEHYRQLWSACYPTPAGSCQEQERSDHGTAHKSTAVLALNLIIKSRKMRSSLPRGRSLLCHLLTTCLSRTTTSPVRDCAPNLVRLQAAL